YARGPRAGSAWTGLSEAVAFLRGDRRISTIVVLMAVFSIFGFSYLVMMPVFARQVLHRGAAGYGLMMTAVGVGALSGALAVAVGGAATALAVTVAGWRVGELRRT